MLDGGLNPVYTKVDIRCMHARFDGLKQLMKMGSIGDVAVEIEVGRLRRVDQPFPRDECFLPALTVQTHASNLLILKNGDLLCAWFGGSQEGKPDISIYLARLQAGAVDWSAAKQVTFDSSRSEQNPVLFQAQSGELWLLYTSQNAGDQDSAVVKRQISDDNGHTWSSAEILFGEPGTFIRQPVVTLDNSDLVIPTFKCRTEPGKRWVGNDDISAVRISSDQGRTWRDVEVPESFGTVHMQMHRLKDGSYFSLFRSRWADNIYSSTSTDGVQWTRPEATDLPNPNSGICFDVLADGRILAVYNQSSKANATGRREGLYDDIAEVGDNRKNQTAKHGDKEAFWGAPRAPLCLAWSRDNGRSWKSCTLEEGDGYCMTNDSKQKLNRELSYPSIAVADDGMVHIAFTFWRQHIKYVRLSTDVLDTIGEHTPLRDLVVNGSRKPPAMQYQRLGSSGLKVSRIILGCMTFGNPDWQGSPWVMPESEALPLLKKAHDVGINTFETADTYSNGQSEVIIGKALQHYRIPRSKVVIMTKIYYPVLEDQPDVRIEPAVNDGPLVNQMGLSRKHIFEAVEGSLRRLNTSYIDVLQLHRLDRNTDPLEIMTALDDLVKLGKVHYLGASSMHCWELARLHYTAKMHGLTSFSSMSGLYNLLYREEEREMIPFCKAEGIGLLPWSPVARGLLTRPSTETSARSRKDAKAGKWFRGDASAKIIDTVNEMAKAKGCSMAEVALAWVLAKGTCPVIGLNSIGRIENATKVFDVNLSEEDMRKLENPYLPLEVQAI